jgi:hypothetical protein
VSEEPEADDVLVALHQATQPVTPTVQAVAVRWDVRYQDCTTVDELEGS